MFLHPYSPVASQADGFFYKLLLQLIDGAGNSWPFLYPLLTFTLLYTQAVSLNRVINSQRLLNKTNYLTGMSYLLITSLFSEWNHLSPALIINSLLIWVFAELCKLHNNQNPKTMLFNVGIITGLATFLYFPAIAFCLLIIAGLLITRPFRLQEWLMVVLGMLAPYYFMFSWLYLKDRLADYRLPEIGLATPTPNGNTLALIAIVVLFFTMTVGVYFIRLNMRRQLVHSRKSWNLVFLYLLVALSIPFLNETRNFDYWILAAVPVSVIAAAAFLYPERKWFALVVHWGLVALIVVMEYFV